MTKASTALGPVQKGSGKHTGRGRGVGEEERGTGGCVDRRSDDATAVYVEINPQRRRLSRSRTNFALEAIVEYREARAK